MSAEVLNLLIEQGATFSQTITPATPIDLSGYAASGQIRGTASHDSPILATLSVNVAAGVLGIHTLSLTATETASLPTSGATYADRLTYVYDVVATKTASPTLRLENGSVQVSPAVSR